MKNTIPVTSWLVLVILGLSGTITVGDDGLVVKSIWKSLGSCQRTTVYGLVSEEDWT